jgi:fibronectin-binding autotransporter adhesin
MKSNLQNPGRLLASLILLSGSHAYAADQYWDADTDTTVATGGSGDWDATSALWRDGSSTGALGAWIDGNTAILEGTYGLLSAKAAVLASQIKVVGTPVGTAPFAITNTGVTSGNGLGFTGTDPLVDVAAGTSLQITATGSNNATLGRPAGISGTAPLTVQGGGTLTLSGANRVYAGPVTATGTGTTLVITSTNGVDNGAATTRLAANGGATIQLSSTNNYRTSLNLGAAGLGGAILKLGHVSSIGGQGSFSLGVSGTSKSTILSILTNTGIDIGGINANSATGRNVNVAATGDPSGVDLEFSAGWRNATLIKFGAGVFRLNSGFTINRANDYVTYAYANESLRIAAGTFLNEGLVKGRTNVNAGGTARTGATSGTFDAVTVNGTGVFELSRASGTFTSGLTFGPGENSLTLNNGGTLRYVGINPDISPLLNALTGTGGTIDTNSQNVAFATALSGTGGLTKSGAGTLTLDASNTYSGLTSVKAGTLALGSAASISSGSGIHVGAGAIIDLSALAAATYHIGDAFPQVLSGSGTVTVTGKTVVLGASAQLSPGDTAGTLQVDLGSGTLDLSAATDLVFQVGATSDRVLVPTGTLSLGSGTLGFSDFTLSSSGGLASGSYVLLESTDLTGTLDPADLSGSFGPFSGTLSISGDNVILTVVASPFDTFMETFSSQIPNALNRGPAADPDNDGVDNLTEFALKGNPADGSNNGLLAVLLQDTDTPADTDELTLVAAVRRGAVFSANANNAQQATEDSVIYAVEGSLNLGPWATPVSALATGSNTAPAASGLTEDLTGTDWEYRTFSLDASEALTGKGFLRVQVSQ